MSEKKDSKVVLAGGPCANNDLLDNQYWKDKLTPEEFEVCRLKGTDRPFSGAYYHTSDKGVYSCKCCGQELFSSETKYDSGSGWPSFFAAIDAGRVTTHKDSSHGMVRVEITCARCGCHLGHLFDDGPQPTGQRYCVNSTSLKFSFTNNDK